MATSPNIVLQASNATGTLTAQSTNFTVTPSATTTAGDLGLIQIWNGASATTPEITSISGGGTWTRVASSTNGITSSELWYCPNMSAVSSITVTPAVALTGGWNFAAFSGILATSPLDTSATANGSGTSWSFTLGPTATTTDQVRLVIECDAPQNGGKGGTGTVPNNYTNAQTGGSGGTHGYLNYKIVAQAVGTEACTVSGSSAGSSAVTSIIAVFRPVANVIQQVNTKQTVSGTSITVTAPLNGNALFLMLNNTSGGASTVSQTGASWVKIGTGSDTNCVTELWAAYNVSGAGTTITLGTACVSVYTEVYGLATSPLDQSVTSHGTDTASPTAIPTGTTATTTYAPEIAIASIGSQASGKGATWSTILNSYILLSNTTAGGASILGAYKILTATGTTSTGASLTPTANTNGYGTVLATFNQTQTPAPTVTRISNLALLGCG